MFRFVSRIKVGGLNLGGMLTSQCLLGRMLQGDVFVVVGLVTGHGCWFCPRFAQFDQCQACRAPIAMGYPMRHQNIGWHVFVCCVQAAPDGLLASVPET